MDEKKAPWTWIDGGETPGVRFGETTFAYRAVDGAQFDGYVEALTRANEVFSVLLLARKRFESGAVDYAGACARLNTLLAEYEKAEWTLVQVARGIANFFEPVGPLAQAIAGLDGAILEDFAREAIGKLQARRQKDQEPEEKVA
jgi:hypothetical protein